MALLFPLAVSVCMVEGMKYRHTHTLSPFASLFKLIIFLSLFGKTVRAWRLTLLEWSKLDLFR